MNNVEMAKSMIEFANTSQIGMTPNQLCQMRDMAKHILLAEAASVRNSGCAEACYMLDGMMDTDAENDAMVAKAAAMGHEEALRCVETTDSDDLKKAYEDAVREFNVDGD